MDETKNKYILYFINVFISGLVYSFMTSKLLSLGVHNSLIIIFIASVVDLVITYDTKKVIILSKYLLIFIHLFPY